MYASYFGLRDKPFNATPDPRFFYTNRGYQEAYAALLYGIQERKGFIALTGEVGTGKTTLLRRLMDNLNPAVKVVFLYNTTLTFDELVEFVCAELDLAVSGTGRVPQLQALNAFLIAEAKRGGTVVLLLDEAQNLSAEALENLRLISNLETSTAKLLQIVLVGQPELEGKLADPALRQVTQRIAIRHRLERLSDAEVEPFIDHRLRVTGRQRRDLFTDEAIQTLIPYVSGIPRLINIVCDNALLLAYGADTKRVTGSMIEEVVADLWLKPPGPLPASPLPTPRASEQPGRQRAGVWSRAVSSAGWGRAGVAGVTALALLGVAAAGLGDRLGIAWHLPSISSLADRTPAGGRQLSSATGTTAGRGSEQIVTSASLPVGHSGGQPAVPETEPAGSLTGGGELGSAGVGEVIGRILTIPRGGTISKIAFNYYGRYSSLALDLIQEMNPEIRNIEVVLADQPLWLPPLNMDALLRRQADGSYRIILTSQPGLPAATEVAKSVRKHGYSAAVTTRKVASGQVLYRVEIDNLKTRAAAIRAWETARRLGWFDLKPEAPSSRYGLASGGLSSRR